MTSRYETTPVLSPQNFTASLEYMERARAVIPLGVTSSSRAAQRPVPIVVARAQGSRLYDIDGNEYIDYLAGWGPMLLGHQSKPVVEAVRAQLERGEIFGTPHEGELELAERIVRLVPCAEMVTFLSSGSEAVHLALAIARGATGRRRVLKFDGQFNGWIAPLRTNMPGMPAVGHHPPYAARPDAGWPPSGDEIVICPWNDIAAFEAEMERVGGSLAAVIMEPVACNWGSLAPVPGYLERARELCDAYGAVLIFDEVITGFRLALGGAQQLLGVKPDLATFAKALGGGFPISAVAGRREVMEAASEGPVRAFGTYNGSPVPVAAANATLAELESRGSELYASLERRSANLASGILASAKKHAVPLRVSRVGSLLSLVWGLGRDPVTYFDVAASETAPLELLGEELTLRGIYTGNGHKLLISAAHSDDDIAKTLHSFDNALQVVASSTMRAKKSSLSTHYLAPEQ
nr:aminotransferase class III-fold pyridoxal phosphate-dependent enzyme [Mesorhizobium sp. LNHC220B00]